MKWGSRRILRLGQAVCLEGDSILFSVADYEHKTGQYCQGFLVPMLCLGMHTGRLCLPFVKDAELSSVRPGKLWSIYGAIFWTKPSFRQNVLGSEVQDLVPSDFPNNPHALRAQQSMKIRLCLTASFICRFTLFCYVVCNIGLKVEYRA